MTTYPVDFVGGGRGKGSNDLCIVVAIAQSNTGQGCVFSDCFIVAYDFLEFECKSKLTLA